MTNSTPAIGAATRCGPSRAVREGVVPSSNEERWLVRYSNPISVKFTGVWDTVGAVPTNNAFHLLTGGDHSFLDVNLRKTEEYVFHALAIDENRNGGQQIIGSQIFLRSHKRREPRTAAQADKSQVIRSRP